MNKKEFFNAITRSLGRTKLKLDKHSPEILVIAGVVGMGVAAVIACVRTKKCDEVKEELNNDLTEIEDRYNDPNILLYDDKVKRKDTAIAYGKAALGYIRVYAPAITIGTVSATAVLCGHNILRKRSIAISAALAEVTDGFNKYRNEVVERFGEEVDKEIRYNVKEKEAKNVTVTDKNGCKIKESDGYSEFARFFDESCSGWSKDPERSLIFIRRQQDYANELLKSHGYLFLNEVYKMFDIQPTKAGQIVGWIYDENNPTFVDFGVYNIDSERARAFVNGYERNILLDFNVMGNILDQI